MDNLNCFTTNDGVRLHYIDKGSGEPLILLHGYSQSADLFKFQIEDFKQDYRVIALDMRGHGLSDKPESGYKISRFAKDLRDFLSFLNPESVNLLGHSMGCSVIWSYLELFGSKGVGKLIFVDQQPFMTINPLWSEEKRREVGASLTANQIFDYLNSLNNNGDGESLFAHFIRGRFSSGFDENLFSWVLSENLKLPFKYSGKLFLNHATQDWREVISEIDKPSLIITGEKTVESQMWIHNQIVNSQIEKFYDEDEEKSHFMFIENPKKFNKVVRKFLK